MLCYPHDNIVGSHVCDECMKSILLTVCRKPESVWRLLLQICSRTRECQVYQFVPSTSIRRQFVTILLTILPLIHVPISCNGEHPSKDLRLCVTALSFCSPSRNIFHRIFEHVLPCRKTTQPSLSEVIPTLLIVQLLQQKFVIRTFPGTE